MSPTDQAQPSADDPSSVERLATERFSRLLALMETAAEPPVLEFRFVERTRGLDYVAEVRGGGTSIA